MPHPGEEEGEGSREASEESGLVVQPQEGQIPGGGGGGECQILQGSDGSHIDIADLSSEPLLAVKPLRRITAAAAALSSFEALYDTTELEEVPGDLALGGEQMRPEDRFQGTRTTGGGVGLPGLSSFENIYELPGSALPSSTGSLRPIEELPGARWSAPADTLEPPVLIREEFDQRYGAVRDKIAEHFSDISELVGKEEGGNAGKGAEKAKKGQAFAVHLPDSRAY